MEEEFYATIKLVSGEEILATVCIDETNEELWIKIKSLSTSGNYSIIVKSNQMGTVGQEFIENHTHISYKNKGININSSNENNQELLSTF